MNIPIGFEYVEGRHTGVLIKKQFDSMLDMYDISDKVFKIVADQAANMKKAFKETTSATVVDLAIDDYFPVSKDSHDSLDFVENLTYSMLFKQRKKELISQKEDILKKQMQKEIYITYIILLP